MRQVWVGLVGVLAAVLLAGCATMPAYQVTSTTAWLNGNGISDSPDSYDYFFRWADSAVDLAAGRGRQTEVVARYGPREWSPGFEKHLTGLTPDTTYTYEACGRIRGAAATQCYGVQTFTTDPAVCTAAFTCAAELTTWAARTASFNATGFSTSRPLVHWFEVTPSGGATTRTPEIGPETLTAKGFSVDLTGLTPDQAYDVRACARLVGEGARTICAGRDFTTDPAACTRNPACRTEAPSQVTDTSAFLRATGLQTGEPLVHWFRITEPRPTGESPFRETPRRGPVTLTAGAVSEPVTGLDPGTYYRVQLCVQAVVDDEPTCEEGQTFHTTTPDDRVCGSDSGPDLHCTYEAVDVTTTTGAVRVAGLTPDREYEAWVQVAPKPRDPENAASPGFVASGKQTIRPGVASVRLALTGLKPGFITHDAVFCLRAPGVSKATCIPAGFLITRSGPPAPYEHRGGRVTVSGTRVDSPSFEWTDTSLEIAALADADGSNARGTVTATRRVHGAEPRDVVTTGAITCMNVIGRRATINVQTPAGALVSFFVDAGDGSNTASRVLRYYDAKRDSPADCSPEKGEPRIPWVSFNNGVFEVVPAP